MQTCRCEYASHLAIFFSLKNIVRRVLNLANESNLKITKLFGAISGFTQRKPDITGIRDDLESDSLMAISGQREAVAKSSEQKSEKLFFQ